MNTGVEIILQRVKDNPEDFDYSPHNGGMSRWSRIVDHALSAGILTSEELDAIKLAQLEASRERFTELVMKELAGENDDPKESSPYLANLASTTVLGGTTLGAYSNTSNLTLTTNATGQMAWSNTATNAINPYQQIQNAQLETLLELHIEEGKRKAKEAESRQPRSLIGKLFNYT